MSDCQAGHEKTLTGLLAQLAGASSIYGPGMLESGVTFDIAQLVADNELIRMMKYCRAGIQVDDAQLMVDEIVAAGPESDYLSSDSTIKGMRALSTTQLIDRQVREAWEAAGSPEFYAHAREDARRIVNEHHVDPLPDDVAAQMDTIVRESTTSAKRV